MNTIMTKHDDHIKANTVTKANNTVRLTAPDRSSTPGLALVPRPVADDDDDAQWVMQRMFDHYNG